MGKDILTVRFTNLSDLHKALGIAGPKHPLFSIIKFEDLPVLNNPERTKLILDFIRSRLRPPPHARSSMGRPCLISMRALYPVSDQDKVVSLIHTLNMQNRAGW